MIDDPRPLTRSELSKFLPTQRAIRAFEKLFDLVPTEFVDQQEQIDALELMSIAAGFKAEDAVAAIVRLAEAIETLALAPAVETDIIEDELAPQAESDSTCEDDLAPADELGTIAAQNAHEVEITGGTVVAEISDSTTNLIASTQTLTDGAGVAAGTLTNAPSAGDPTSWVAIDDNGTTRHIPAW